MSLHSTENKEIERKLYESRCFVEGLLPETEEEIRETRQLFGSTPITMPNRLRSPDEVLKQIKQQVNSTGDEPQTLGCIVRILRTEKKLSIEALSEKSGVGVPDLHAIESEPCFSPKPLVVSKLARFFKLSPNKLALLAKHVSRVDDSLHEVPLQFAACSNGSYADLTHDQKKIFHQYIKQLRAKG